jgi:hypothetical protein
VASYSSEVNTEDFTASQGTNGVSWYHYFGPSGQTFFTCFGIAFYVFRGEDGYRTSFENDPAFGGLVGGGYESARHWQLGVYVGAGRTTEPGIDYDHYHVNVLIGGIAF